MRLNCGAGSGRAMLAIDAAHGEGGGQLVRMACALAALTGTSIRLSGIRARRDPSGLAPQHLTAVQAIAAMCGAQTEGLALRTGEFVFRPGATRGGDYRFDVGTAGSITLVLQAVLPVALSAPTPTILHITGGTDVRAAPPFDYFRYVLLPQLQRLGLDIEATLVRRGYYPRGGGAVAVRVRPGVPSALLQDRAGELLELGGHAHIANLPAHILDRMQLTAVRELSGLGVPRIETQQLGHDAAFGAGGAIVLWARTSRSLLGGSEVAQRGVPAERIAATAARALVEDLRSGATLDVHASDQLLIYLALARQPSYFLAHSWSSHAATTAWLIEQFLPARFTPASEGACWRVRVTPGGEGGRSQ
jgi:RNA 3'-terminal phosphate cyclase (ATP)